MAQTNTIIATPGIVNLTAPQGQTAAQEINVYSTPGSVALTVTVQPANSWLAAINPGTVSPSSANNPNLIIEANAGTLNPGLYQGNVTISGPNANPVSVQVNLNVTTSSGGGGTGNYTSNPSMLNFQSTVGGPPQSQTFTLTTTDPTAFNVAVNAVMTNGSGWLGVTPLFSQISPGAPATFTVNVTPGLLPASAYNGFIQVTSNGNNTTVLQVPVTLNVGSGTGTSALSATPGTLTFTFATGATTTQTQPLTVSTTSQIVETLTATATVSQGSNWLTINGASSPAQITITNSVPATLNINVNPMNLTSGVTYNGNIAVSSRDLGTINIPVSATIGTSTTGGLTASPNPVNINIPAGSTTPVNQSLTVSATTQTSFTATATTTTGQNWLSVNPPSLQTAAPNAPVTLTVSANPLGLPTGMFSGSVILTPQGGGNPISIPVNLQVGGTPALTVNPTVLNFAYQTGTANPPAQTFSITSTGNSVGFGINATSNGGNWLIVNPQSGATSATAGTPTPVTVSVNPSGLQAGATYQGIITVTEAGAQTSQTVMVNLLVSTQPILTLGANTVTFNYQFGSNTLPQQQQVQLLSSGNPLSFTTTINPGTGGNWLTVTPSSGTTPQQLSLSVNQSALTSLAPGNYVSTVVVNAPAAGNSPLTLQVMLVIGNNTLLTTTQSSLNFNYQIGQTPPVAQALSIGSTGSPLNFTAAATSTNCGGNFLTVVQGTSPTTPANIAVSVNPVGQAAGTCNGTITLTSPGAGNSPLVLPVTFNVSTTPLLNVSPAVINVTTQVGSSPAGVSVALTSTDPNTAIPLSVTSTTNNGGSWLLLGQANTTPSNLNIGFQTANLAVGTYTGSITVSPMAAGSTPTVIPVQLVVSTSASASTTPPSLTFTQAFNGPAPANAQLQINSSTQGLTFAATAGTLNGGNWLSIVSTNTGITPGTVTVAANGSTLGQGSYQGFVTIVIPGAANSPVNVPVTLNVGPQQTLSVGSGTVNFTYQAGSATTPATQNVPVTSTGGSVNYTVTVTSTTPNLFTVTPANGTTPSSLMIGLNQSVLSGLTASNTPYTGTVTITSPAGTQVIALNVTVQPTAVPQIATLVNSASNVPGAVSPGEIVTIYGTNIGPATALGLQLTSAGTVATTLGNTQVLFDGIPAPLIYVSSTQINAVVPYGVAGRATTNLTVSVNGSVSAQLQLRVTDSAPGIFTTSQGGSGQGAILNQNLSPNSSTNPATKGTVIAIYATGEGALTPPTTIDGTVTSATPPYPMPVDKVSVTIDGQPATIQYAGEAPGLVSGVLQVNVVVPTSIMGTGNKTVLLTIGGNSNNQQTVTVAVQ